MHAADGRFVVVDQPYAAFAVIRADDDFLLQLAPQAFLVRVGRGLADIFGRDMPADADAAFAMQATLSLAGAAGVFKEADDSVRIGVPKDGVRNQLLEAGVFLHFP